MASADLMEWFNAWRMPLYRWIKHKYPHSVMDADDVIQETFLRMLKYKADCVEHPQTYLFRTATNIILEEHERMRNIKPHDGSWLDALENEDAPDVEAENATNGKRLKLAIDKLNARQRNVLYMCHVRDLDKKKVAFHLGTTQRIVKRDLERAVGRLRQELGEI